MNSLLGFHWYGVSLWVSEKHSKSFLFQSIGISIQKGNTACILGTKVINGHGRIGIPLIVKTINNLQTHPALKLIHFLFNCLPTLWIKFYFHFYRFDEKEMSSFHERLEILFDNHCLAICAFSSQLGHWSHEANKWFPTSFDDTINLWTKV